MIIFLILRTPIPLIRKLRLYSPGNYSIEWNGEKYSSGVYFVKMVSENFIDTQKLMLMK